MKFSKKKKNNGENKGEDKGIVESFLGGMPYFREFFKELGKTEVFKERFKDVNEKIEENLRKSGARYVNIESNISVRPLSIRPSARSTIGEIKKADSEVSIGKDYFYGKKGNKLVLAVKAPKDVDLSIKGKNLFITGEDFEKKLELPDYYKNIVKKQYRKGILAIELSK